MDVLVVGARCAGATLAIHLGRAGKRVAVVDSCDMPSDQPLSTHLIGPYGMSLLDELELGDKVRAFAPPLTLFINGVEDEIAYIELPGTGGSCPRRHDLDALLVEEARAAGAELRLRTKVVDLVREGERVVGAVVQHGGGREEIRARFVVGADGRHSTVAELVAAEEYHGYDTPRGSYWAYWPRPTWYSEDPRYRGGVVLLYAGDDFLFAFPANKDQLLIGVAFPMDDLPTWRARQKTELVHRLSRHPLMAPLAEGEPGSDVVGYVKGRYYFRQAAGPGWALVGDAGLFKDPAPGLGIADAFRDARSLARALLDGGDDALVRYWRERDVRSTELFEFARNLADLQFNNPLNRLVFSKLARYASLRERIVAIHTREISPFAAFSPAQLVGWTFGAMLRGNFGVVKPFLAAGKHSAAVKAELKRRMRLLREATR